jgi:mitochondrial fission protein ELM1
MFGERSEWSSAALPRVWLLMGGKPGDNAQVRTLAEALGWPFETKRVVFRRTELITNLLFGGTLAGVVQGRSTPLDPPWPDLIISAGRRNEPVARWIQTRAGKGGQRTRLVHLGRPWASPRRFDLIVTTPQYQVPALPNTLENDLPLHGVSGERLAVAAQVWAPRLDRLSRPYVAVLVGGNSGPYTFQSHSAARLGKEASTLARRLGGSLLITTSARTPTAAIRALEAGITVPAELFRWRHGAADNPYLGFLALADSIIVTGDSVSMLTEACATGKPVYIHDFFDEPVPATQQDAGHRAAWLEAWRPAAVLSRVGMRVGPPRMRRDVRAIHRRLIACGRAVWMGERFPEDRSPGPLEDLSRAVARVQRLFAEASGECTLNPQLPAGNGGASARDSRCSATRKGWSGG